MIFNHHELKASKSTMFYILFVFTYSELMTEKMNARIGILPLLQAEHDRKYAMGVHAHPFLMF